MLSKVQKPITLKSAYCYLYVEKFYYLFISNYYYANNLTLHLGHKSLHWCPILRMRKEENKKRKKT